MKTITAMAAKSLGKFLVKDFRALHTWSLPNVSMQWHGVP